MLQQFLLYTLIEDDAVTCYEMYKIHFCKVYFRERTLTLRKGGNNMRNAQTSKIVRNKDANYGSAGWTWVQPEAN
jgi:hypothetical protein